jgi:hypothetical protein
VETIQISINRWVNKKNCGKSGEWDII